MVREVFNFFVQDASAEVLEFLVGGDDFLGIAGSSGIRVGGANPNAVLPIEGRRAGDGGRKLLFRLAQDIANSSLGGSQALIHKKVRRFLFSSTG